MTRSMCRNQSETELRKKNKIFPSVSYLREAK